MIIFIPPQLEFNSYNALFVFDFFSGNAADNTLVLGMKRSSTSTRICLVCRSKDSLKTYTEVERCEILLCDGIFISANCTYCPKHKEYDLNSLPDSHWLHEFNTNQLNAMCILARSRKKHEMRKEAKDAKERKRAKVAIDVTPNEVVLSELQIQDLIHASPILTDIATKTSLFRATMIVKVYLMTLRKGLTMDELHCKFRITLVTIRRFLKLAREAFTVDIVKKEFGFANTSREILLSHMTQHTTKLHCGNDPTRIITIWDGTYIFAEKSGNYEFQKKSWGVHKNRNLVKPMVVVSPDGYIVDIFCTYAATANDAKIIETVFATELDVMRVLKPKDVILADRGFRSSPADLKKYGLIWKLPAMSENGRQLTTKEANNSRLVTRCRWPVEVINGHIKSIWRIFDQRWRTGALEHLECDIHIAAAIMNKYLHTPLLSDGDDNAVIERILEKFYSSSRPAFNAIVQNKNGFQKELKATGKFTSINSENFEFPRINLKELREYIGMGTYQVEQAQRYTVTHMRNNFGFFESKTCEVDLIQQYFHYQIQEKELKMPALVVTNMSSRHRSGVKYQTIVFFDNVRRGAAAIISYCCGCINGQRTVGCCSHVMAIIYYFGYARHLGKIHVISPGLNSLLKNVILKVEK